MISKLWRKDLNFDVDIHIDVNIGVDFDVYIWRTKRLQLW